MKQTTLFGGEKHIRRSAEISECGRYRWRLRRARVNFNKDGQPAGSKGVCCFIMLNPSTADGLQDDRTICRCISFAKDWGYSTLSVRNLFPWRETKPANLPKDLILITGGHRGMTELVTALTADLVVCAWGAKVPFDRDIQILDRFKEIAPAKPLHCVRLSDGGKPWHPLYVSGDTQPMLFQEAK